MATEQMHCTLQNAPQEKNGLALRYDTSIVEKLSLLRETDFADELPLRHEMSVVDFSRIIPTKLPEALRAASKRAFGHATDPLNQLDYNPYIGDEWAIVAAEFQSLAGALERRFRALFDGKDQRLGLTQLQSTIRNRVREATPHSPQLHCSRAVRRAPACSRGFLSTADYAVRRFARAA